MSDKSYPVTGTQTGRVSSPGRKSIAELISVTGLQPLNLALRGDVVKNGRKWILILATQYKINPEEYEVLDRLVGEFVSVHAIELGVHFTTTLLKRKGRDYIYAIDLLIPIIDGLSSTCHAHHPCTFLRPSLRLVACFVLLMPSSLGSIVTSTVSCPPSRHASSKNAFSLAGMLT